MLRVVSWNVNAGRGVPEGKVSKLCDALARLDPDLLLLQEVASDHNARARLASGLAAVGLTEFYAPSPTTLSYGCAIASRWPLSVPETELSSAPFPELIAAADMTWPGGRALCLSVHAPNGSGHGWKKIETIECASRDLKRLDDRLAIVGGDFNEPVAVLADGTFVSKAAEGLLPGGSLNSLWGRTEKPVRRPDGAEIPGVRRTYLRQRWQTAVVQLLQPDLAAGHVHTHRRVHGAGSVTSHVVRGTERFFDHIVVSRAFEVVDAGYDHGVRRQPSRASDHSVCWAVLKTRT
jgi:hypothetical protein